MASFKLDQALFLMAFERDVDYQNDPPEEVYLDLVTGDLAWVYEEDDDAETYGLCPDENREMRERIEAEPKRFLLIPGLSHGEHHDILKAFLRSDWTEDEDQHEAARNAYFGSIGGWKKTIRDEAVMRAYYRFRDQRIVDMADAFLSGHGVNVDWDERHILYLDSSIGW
jgi:hypothetical protein